MDWAGQRFGGRNTGGQVIEFITGMQSYYHCHRGAYEKQFKEAIDKDDYLEQFKDGLDKKQLTMYLRAGNWDVKVALELLKSFYNFGRDFRECVKASLPSKYILRENFFTKYFLFMKMWSSMGG